MPRKRKYQSDFNKGMNYLSSNYNQGKQLARDVKKLKKLINIERKVHTIDQTVNGTYSASLVTLNNPAQGVADTQRIGDSIKNQKLDFAFSITSGSDCEARIMIIEDKNNDITASDLLLFNGTVFATLSPKQWDHRYKTKVLYDKAFTLAAGQDTHLRIGKFNLNLGHHTQFDNTSTTILTGAYKLVFVSNTVAATPILRFTSRVEYTDD